MPIFSTMGYSSSKLRTSCLLPPTWSRRIAESGLVRRAHRRHRRDGVEPVAADGVDAAHVVELRDRHRVVLVPAADHAGQQPEAARSAPARCPGRSGTRASTGRRGSPGRRRWRSGARNGGASSAEAERKKPGSGRAGCRACPTARRGGPSWSSRSGSGCRAAGPGPTP